MPQDWKAFVESSGGAIGNLAQGNSGIMRGIAALAKAGEAKDALDAKTRELIALAVASTTRCDACIGIHAAEAVKAGATRDELLGALAVAVSLNAGAALVYSSHVLEAYDQFAK